MDVESPILTLSQRQPNGSTNMALNDEWLSILNLIVEKGYYSFEAIQDMLNNERYDEYVTAVMNEVASVDDEIAEACLQMMANMAANGTQSTDVGQTADDRSRLPEKSPAPDNKPMIHNQDEQIQEISEGDRAMPSSPTVVKRKQSPTVLKGESVKVPRNKMEDANVNLTKPNVVGILNQSGEGGSSGVNTSAMNASGTQAKSKRVAFHLDNNTSLDNPSLQQSDAAVEVVDLSDSPMEVKKAVGANPLFSEDQPPEREPVRMRRSTDELLAMVEELDSFGKNDEHCKMLLARSVHEEHVRIARGMVEMVREQGEMLERARQLLAQRRQEKQMIIDKMLSALTVYSDKKK